MAMVVAAAALGFFGMLLRGRRRGRARPAGAAPALAGLVGAGALRGLGVFRNGPRHRRFRCHGCRRTRALLAPPLAAPGPVRSLLLSRIRRTRFERPLAGIGVAHVFVHSRRAKTFRPQQAPA